MHALRDTSWSGRRRARVRTGVREVGRMWCAHMRHPCATPRRGSCADWGTQRGCRAVAREPTALEPHVGWYSLLERLAPKAADDPPRANGGSLRLASGRQCRPEGASADLRGCTWAPSPPRPVPHDTPGCHDPSRPLDQAAGQTRTYWLDSACGWIVRSAVKATGAGLPSGIVASSCQPVNAPSWSALAPSMPSKGPFASMM